MPERRAKRGDPLRMSAQTFNTMVDLTRLRNTRRGGRPMTGNIVSSVKFGKATGSWTSGNTITVTPVTDYTGATPTGEDDVTLNIFSPSGTPSNVQISINNIVAYMTAPDGTHWVLNPNHGSFTSLGTAEYQVYQMTSSTTAAWDFTRAST